MPTTAYAMARVSENHGCKPTADISSSHHDQSQQLESFKPVVGADGVAKPIACRVFSRLTSGDPQCRQVEMGIEVERFRDLQLVC